MTYLLQRRWLLLLCLCAFAICKIPHLSLGFYWDESWVYGPSVYTMYEHGPSLSPAAIPLDYSRGHPLLFQALCAGWMKIFGPSHISVHSFALFISLSLTIGLYEMMHRLFNERAALISVILLLTDHFFLINSSFILNDIMLGLFALAAIYFYATSSYLAAAIFITLCYYTKESGMVLAPIICIDVVIASIKKYPRREIISRSLCLVLPLMAIGEFYAAQKALLGWYLNPGHTGLIDLSFKNTLSRMNQTATLLLISDSKFFVWGFALFVSLFALFARKNLIFLAFMIGMASAYLYLEIFSYKDVISILFDLFYLVCLALLYFTKSTWFSAPQQRFVQLLVAFFLFYTYFCCINFFEGRYLFPSLLISLILLTLILDRCLDMVTQKTFFVTLSGLSIVGLISFTQYHDELTNIARIQAQDDVVKYLEHTNCYNKHIYCPGYLESVHLTDPKTGFLHSQKTFHHVKDVFDDGTEVMVFDELEQGPFDTLQNHKNFTLLTEIRRQQAWARIYVRKP